MGYTSMEGLGFIRCRSKAAITVFMFATISGCTSLECPPGDYYDTAVARCDSCQALCDFYMIQGTSEDCATYCPEYFVHMKLTTLSPKRPSEKSVLNDRSKSEKDWNKEESNDHHILLIPIIAGVVVCVCVVVVVGVILVITDKRTKDLRRTHRDKESACLKVDLLWHSNGTSGQVLDTHTKYPNPGGSVI